MVFRFITKNIGKVVNPSKVKEWDNFGGKMDKAFFDSAKTATKAVIKQNKINKKRSTI